MKSSVILVVLFAVSSFAQEVIMNVPSADVPNKNQVFLRSDSFYTQHPAYFNQITNEAVGLGHGLEVSTNEVDLTHGLTYVVPGFKWQIVNTKNLTFYVGDQVTVPTSDGLYGDNAYEAFAWKYGQFRATAGSFQSHNAAQTGNRAGAVLGLEWTAKVFRNGWTITPGIDWASGAGSNGYTSPGLMFSKKSFFICPGYMIGNPHNKFGAHQSFVMIGITL